MVKIYYLLYLIYLKEYVCDGRGTLPDASQEGILKQFGSYDDLALFHYRVPSETTRATWEFASFQDEIDCPSREVMIYLQHGSFPVIPPQNASFDSKFYTNRTELHYINTSSAYQPHDTTIFPMYNPLPGSWYAFAFLSPFEEKITQQGLLHKCRYSLGSIGLWTRAEQVQWITPFAKQRYATTKHFSYFKFFLPDNVDSFQLHISNCSIKQQIKEGLNSRDECIDYTNLRPRALPRHDPGVAGFTNITIGGSVVFSEERPYKSSYYYLLVVSSAVINFELELNYSDCGEAGLYGRNQRNWYLTHQGLKFNNTMTMPKEPQKGFQLFTVNDHPEIDVNYDLDAITNSNDAHKRCYSVFDFNRIDLVEDFSVNFVLQGRRWYTKWITVSNRFPIITRFKTEDYLDTGGTLNIVIRIDDQAAQLADGQVVRVYGCLSQGRYPKVVDDVVECAANERIEVASDSPTANTTKLIPFPEPSTWFLALQVECIHPTSRKKIDCWGNMRFGSVMSSIAVHLQPCGYRPEKQICGDFGVCVRSHKGNFLYTSCRCASGYSGWTCDQTNLANPAKQHQSNTLLLTLSNLSFLPVILLSLWYRLYTEALLYFSTMFFSTFYHTCDQEINHKHLPEGLERACHALYVSKEVLQFCDFFCAIMSFWVTIISMAKLPEKLVNFLHMLGVLLISVLVQYNRNGIQVFAVPIPLGVAVLILSVIVRCYQRKKLLRINKTCSIWLSLAIASAVSAVLVFALVETTTNYQYVHSVWHCLISMSLVFLLPYCNRTESKPRRLKSESLSTSSSGTTNASAGGVFVSGESAGIFVNGSTGSTTTNVLSDDIPSQPIEFADQQHVLRTTRNAGEMLENPGVGVPTSLNGEIPQNHIHTAHQEDSAC